MRPRLAIGAALALALAGAAIPQDGVPPAPVAPDASALPASLVADNVSFDQQAQRLVASGNVEVLYQGRVLHASRIVYDQAADRISAEGPIVLTDPQGGVLLADSAALTPDLTEGLVSSARLLIAGKLQLAAVEVRRENERFATLDRVVASTCTICAGNPTPTWAIRAARVTRDSDVRRLYFQDARVEMFGLPVAWLPMLSIPEPGVERATGLLFPSFKQSDIYGFGMMLPYYRTLGPSADMTVTPFPTTKGGVLLEGEYRKRWAIGGFDAWAVSTLDSSLDGHPGRGALFASGAFRLGQGFLTDFSLQVATDDSFLQQYDYSDVDRLTSYVRVSRTRLQDNVELAAVGFQSLRDDEDTATVPFAFPTFSYRRLFDDGPLGGRLGLDAQSLGIIRDEGVNMVRAGGGADWSRRWLLPHGVLAETTGRAVFDIYQVWNDPVQPDGTELRGMPTASAELRWPLARATGRAEHVVEPIVQLIWSDYVGEVDVPNEDSQLPEFDETNLFSLNRFPGEDRLETGLRANLGVRYTRYAPSGWTIGATLGRVVRAEAQPFYPDGGVISNGWSDYVGALYVDFGTGLAAVNRAAFSPDLDFRRNEFALAYDTTKAGLIATYVFLAETDDPYLDAEPTTSELSLDARYRVLPNWELRGLWRYDLEAGKNLRAGAGIGYGNECAEFDLSVSRRYTSSDNLPPSTSIGFNLQLAGIGEDGERDWPPRVCGPQGI
jgi:LPS-assembly protein